MERPALPSYGDILRDYTSDYRGKRERAIRSAADIFAFYAALFAEPRLPRAQRPLVSAVLAYFVVADDVIPEDEHGPLGLLDDLYVAAHAYRRLARDVPSEVLVQAWPGEEAIDDVMANVYAEARAGVGKRGKDALRLAGI